MTQTSQYGTIRQSLAPGQRQLVTGLNGSAETLFIASLLHEEQRSIVYVTDTLYLPVCAVYSFRFKECARRTDSN